MKVIFSFVFLFTFLCSQLLFAQNPIEVSNLQVKDEISYYKNKPFTGEAYEMYNSTKKAVTAHFKDGKLDGKLVRYHENGLPSSFEEFNGGEIISRKQTYENGKIYTVEKFKNGKYDGEQIEYHLNGNYADKIFYKDGKPEGLWVAYYENGNIATVEKYRDGKQEGEQKIYHENGKLMATGAYKNGKAEGVWERYDDKGELLAKGTYKNGKKEGVWEQYDNKRELLAKGTLKNEKKEGVWEWYDDKGELLQKIFYTNGSIDNYKTKQLYSKDFERKGPEVKRPEKNVISNAIELQRHIRTLLWMARDGFKEIRGKQIKKTNGYDYSGNFFPAKLIYESNYSIGSKNSTITRNKSTKDSPEKYISWVHSTKRLQVEGMSRFEVARENFEAGRNKTTLQKEYEKIIDSILPSGWIKKYNSWTDKVVQWRECSGTRQGHFVTLNFANGEDFDDSATLALGAYDKPCPGSLNLPPRTKTTTRANKYDSIQKARKAGNVDAIRIFLDHGANVNSRHEDGCPLLHHAVQYGQMEVVQLLLDRGAEINARNNHRSTPLLVAPQYQSDPAYFRLLLSKGADVNATCVDADTPLHILAMFQDNLEVAQVLLDAGVNINARNNSGQTAYDIAKSKGHMQLAEMLLENDPNR